MLEPAHGDASLLLLTRNPNQARAAPSCLQHPSQVGGRAIAVQATTRQKQRGPPLESTPAPARRLVVAALYNRPTQQMCMNNARAAARAMLGQCSRELLCCCERSWLDALPLSVMVAFPATHMRLRGGHHETHSWPVVSLNCWGGRGFRGRALALSAHPAPRRLGLPATHTYTPAVDTQVCPCWRPAGRRQKQWLNNPPSHTRLHLDNTP